jgi:serine/threonine protein kinase
MGTGIQRIGKYELRERLRQDKIAEIWKAFDGQSQHYVVLKLLHAHLQNDPSFLKRFGSVAKKIKSLHHPNLLQVYDIQISYPSQTGNATSYIVMDYIEGQTLADYIHGTSRLGNFPTISEIIYILTTIASALDYAHQQGLSYCNVRPTNIVLDKRNTSRLPVGEPTLINYEIPTLLSTSPDSQLDASPLIAPEQTQGAAGNESSDIYLLGIILYELCTGAPPFTGESLKDGVAQHTHQILPPEVLNRHISPALSRIIMQGLAENPAARFSSASALASAAADALNALITTPSTQVLSPTPPPSLPPVKKRKHNPLFTTLISLLVLLVVGAGTLFSVLLSKPPNIFAANPIVGHAYFASSGQFVDNSINGINDELHLVLSNIPPPASGKSYYLWLLSDEQQNPMTFIALGKVPGNHPNIDITYTTPQHTNLIATTSRLLITEENTNPPPTRFSSDSRTWRYTAELPQPPTPISPFTNPLRYLRLLMVESNKMAALGLHGGSAYWLLINTQKVLEWAGSARDEWDLQNAPLMHRHFIRILDYIDGLGFVQADLPPGTPVLVNPLLAQYGLVTIVPGDNPESYPPRVSYNVLSFVETAANHLSPDKQKLGLQTERDIRTNVEAQLQLVRQDARQLFLLTDNQLLQRSTLPLLNDLMAKARFAFSGELDPTAGYLKGGALNDYNNIQLVASFDITPYMQH